MSEKKYIDLLTDFSFKKIFGTEPNKDLLISFLNEIFKGRKKIINLTYNKNEHHGDNKEEGTAIFDLLCTGDQGEIFLIEAQQSHQFQEKRFVLYIQAHQRTSSQRGDESMEIQHYRSLLCRYSGKYR